MNTRERLARKLFKHRHGETFHHPSKGDLPLWDWVDSHGFWDGQRRKCYRDADALLPVVEQIAAERAAEELKAAAKAVDEWGDNAERYRDVVTADSIEHAKATARLMAYGRSSNTLRARAAGLTDKDSQR